MANPQPDKDGTVRIANPLYDAIARFPFSAQQRRCLDAMIRFTYGGLRVNGGQGGPRKTCVLSYGQIGRYLNLERSAVRRGMLRLVEMHVVNKWPTKSGSFSWGIQKDFDRWKWGGTPRPRKCRLHGPTSEDSTAPGWGDRVPKASVDPQAPEERLTQETPTDNPPWETGAPESSSRQTTQTQTQTKDKPEPEIPPHMAATPRQFHQLPDEMKTRLDQLIKDKKWNTAPDFCPYVWMGRTLKTRPGYDPEALEWILTAVDPHGPADNLYAVCNNLLDQAQNEVQHARIKDGEKRERDAGVVRGFRRLVEPGPES